MKVETDFYLINKTLNKSFVKYNGDAVRLSLQTPAKVDEVIIGKKSSPDFVRKITTFKDSNGQIIERAFDYSDKPYQNRIYTNKDSIIGDCEYVTSRGATDYWLDRGAMKYYKKLIKSPKINRKILWGKGKTETNHVAENIYTGEIVQSQVRINPSKNKNRKFHTFIEYPHIKNKKVENKPAKFLSFAVRNKYQTVIKKSIQSQGVKVPQNDSFLGFRALSINDSKEPFAKRFLKERNMADKNIAIDTEYNPINEKNTKFKALFQAEEGEITYNKDAKFDSKSSVVATSAHEAEHSRHFFLQGLLNEGGTPWQNDMAKKFGKLTDEELINEAKTYDEAIKNYVPFWKDREAYSKNEIEILANQKGFMAKNLYEYEGTVIQKDFPHIPPEML